jgi:hypothetical protein
MFYDIYSLITKQERKLKVGIGIKRFYKIWKTLLKKANIEIDTDLQSFCVGYIIGNNVLLKERLLQWDRVQNKLDNGGK